MSTHELYAVPAELATWDVPAGGAARFTWEYDDGRDRLLSLYQRGKDKQWDAVTRVDWDLEVDPYNPLGLPDQTIPIHGHRPWQLLDREQRRELRRHMAAWQFSQFLHGEQAAMICSARIVESVPDLDAKFYAATQTMDEARHTELYARFLQDKLGLVYPMHPSLRALLDDILRDGRWDLPYLGMQVLIEGVALAAFGLLRDLTTMPLPKQLLAFVMQDEARHVAFGRLALRDYYAGLSRAELADREEVVVEGCYLLRDRLRAQEVYDVFGLDPAECMAATEESTYMRDYRSLLFSRIVPCVKDIGLWGDKVQRAYADMGVLDLAGLDLDALMRDDDDIAERVDRDRRELGARAAEVEATVAAGSGADTPS